MSDNLLSRWLKGRKAETLACRHLEKRGLKILTRNFRYRHGEIDIIARDGNQLCVVEVRSRGEGSPLVPEASLSPKKVRKVSRTARGFIRRYRLERVPVRFDLAVVELETGEVSFYPGGIIPRPYL